MQPNSPELTEGLMRSAGSFELVMSSVVFALLGWFVDGRLGTTPLFTTVGVVLGFAGATISLYYRYRARYAEAARHLGVTPPGPRR